MLFTDIEGSTVLLTRLGDAYGELLSAQRALLRAAFAGQGGHELGTEGDGFFVVFESAGDAVLCCLAAQQALSAHDWPDGVPVRVRMGLHSGEPARHEDGYVGLDVHRAARIAAAAHGGQVLLSEATRLLAEPRLPSGVALQDLGVHRLKDIRAPERLYQLAGPGLEVRLRPRSLGTPASLPASLTPLVGRDRDVEFLRSVVAQSRARLVTLTGAGGVGKTRLAVAAAAAMGEFFGQGVFFIPLAAVRDAEGMWAAIAGSLDVTGEGPAADSATRYLADQQALLVLDNVEQLAGAAGVVAELLQTAPQLVIVATSRRPLRLAGEHDYPVPPLGLPRGGGLAEVAGSGAVQMFLQHAQMVRPGFALTPGNAADIVAICRRHDGLPLAIELAAARANLLTPRALHARLGPLDLAAADAGRPSRQQTIRHTIAWSYGLLTSESQDVLRRAGVFAGGCGLDALAAVALSGPRPAGPGPLELAAELLDVSLITVADGADGEPRVSLLETVHDYAMERLVQAGELDEAQLRHAVHYASFAERAQQQLYGPAHLAALDRLEADHGNLAAALRWSLGTAAAEPASAAQRAAIGVRLVLALTAFWYQQGYVAEGRQWLQRAMQLTPDDAGAPFARVAGALAALLAQQGELAAALSLQKRSLAIWRQLGSLPEQAFELNGIGITSRRLGDLPTARSALQESIAISRELGSTGFPLTAALMNLGLTEHLAGNSGEAVQLVQEALALAAETGDVYALTHARLSLVRISLRDGHASEAAEQLAATFGYAAHSGNAEVLATTLELSACIAASRGTNLRAARLAGAAETIREQAGIPRLAEDTDLLEQFLAPARASTAPESWDSELAIGRALSQQDAAALLPGLPAPESR